MRYHPIRRKDVNYYRKFICEKFPGLCSVIEDSKVGYRIVNEDVELIALDNLPVLLVLDKELIPTIAIVKIAGPNSLPRVVVDEGAVKHLINGADVMVPGIVEASDFSIGDIVAVWDPKVTNPLVIGRALMSSDEIRGSKKGRAIKNLHHVGDKAWRTIISFLRALK